MGASVDWSRERFTMDEGLSAAVRETFVQLYEQGLIYRGKRLVNWDPKLHTAVSDLEVENRPSKTGLALAPSGIPSRTASATSVVATTRPETMLGDTAVAVHPEDERYRGLAGKQVIRLPLTGSQYPGDRGRLRGSRVRLRLREDHAGPRLQRLRGGSAPRAAEKINIFTIDAKINDNGTGALPRVWTASTRARRSWTSLRPRACSSASRATRLSMPYGDRSRAWSSSHISPTSGSYAPGCSPSPPMAAVEDGRIRIVPCQLGERPTSSGWRTSRTGASAGRSGGDTGSPRGTTRTARVYVGRLGARPVRQQARGSGREVALRAGRGCAGHLVLVGAVALLHPGLAREDAKP